MTRALAIVSLSALAAGCTPELGAPASLIDQTRILAVKADLPDVLPSSEVTFTALVASPAGTVRDAPLGWAYCTTPKPLSENNAVAARCLQDGVKAFGRQGPSVFGTLPDDGCSRFGPLAPPAEEGDDTSASLRPRDADLTGGYYQPVRVTLVAGAPNGGDLVAFALQRIQCGLVNASIDVNAEFNDPATGYKANRNPSLSGLTGGLDPASLQPLVPEGTQSGAGMLASVTPGAKVTLRVTWSGDSSEVFPVLNTSTRLLDRHGETLRASFFANAGTFEHDVVGRSEAELWTGLEAGGSDGGAAPLHTDGADFADNAWTAPDAQGVYQLWVVLRDSRGGIDFASYSLLVTP